MKYIIEIEEEPYARRGENALYRAKGFNSLVFDKNGLDKLTPLDEALEEAYQKGLHDGTARNENGCVGCIYDNGRIDHSPCDYCCNAYSNQWSAKPCSDEIEVGDEVTYTFIDGAEIPPFVVFVIKDNGENRRYYEGYRRTDGKWVGGGLDYKKTGRHFPQVAELLKAMKEGAE